MSQIVSYKKQALVLILIAITVLLIAEGLARFYEYAFMPCDILYKKAFDNLNWFEKKQICADLSNLTYSEYPIFHPNPNQHSQNVNINSIGLRNDELREKPHELYRIFVVGGSTTFGWHVKDSDAMPQQLQKLLDKQFPEKIQVINAGNPGVTSFEELYLIKNKLIQLQPDMIIIYDGWNDAWYQIAEEKTIKKEPITNDETFKFKNFPGYRTPFVIYRILTDSQTLNLFPTRPTTDIPTITKVVDLWEYRMTEFCELAKKNNFTSVVLLQPAPSVGSKILTTEETKWKNVNKEWNYPLTLDVMKKKLPTLQPKCNVMNDLTGIFDEEKGEIFYDFIHVNAKGNQLIASRISEIITPTLAEKLST